jgi:hypothetical protein
VQAHRVSFAALALAALVAVPALAGGSDAPPFVAHHDAAAPGVVLGTVPSLEALSVVPAGVPGLGSLRSHVRPSCSGTGTDGNRIQVIYAVEAGKKDRYSALLPRIRSWVADVDDTFAASSAKTARAGKPDSRRVRWVHRKADGGCVPTVKHEVLSAGSLKGGFKSTVSALKARGYDQASRKYLVFADTAELCGIGGMWIDSDKKDNANDGDYPSYARVDSPCWTFRAGWHSVPAHEVMHMLGGVQDDAPHSTGAGHCVDETDAMCYDDGGTVGSLLNTCSGREGLFDCRNDDYFNVNPAAGSYLAKNWNPADSSFLDRVHPDPVRPLKAVGSAVRLAPPSS